MKPSTRTNAARQVWRAVAKGCDDIAIRYAADVIAGRKPAISPAQSRAYIALAEELRSRAAGHRGTKRGRDAR